MDLNVTQEKIVTDVTIKNLSSVVDLKLDQIGLDITRYKGEYDVTPTVDGFVLPTAKKVMEKDVNIRAIPFYEVSNQFDGETVYIAKELNYGD